MREAEFHQLLDRVDVALNARTFEDLTEDFPFHAPVAANDNEAPWAHEPFPDGWIASC